MTKSFYRTDLDNEWAFVRGPARLIVAPEDQAFPSEINDVIKLPGEGGNIEEEFYDTKSGWDDLGATKGGCILSVSSQGENISIDPITGTISIDPDTSEATVSTALAENTLEHFTIAWEATVVQAFSNSSSNPERRMNYGIARRHTPRRLAICYINDNSKVRVFVFRRVQLDNNESQLSFQKAGEQQSIPLKFKALADTSIADPKGKFFSVFEQP